MRLDFSHTSSFSFVFFFFLDRSDGEHKVLKTKTTLNHPKLGVQGFEPYNLLKRFGKF
jgi:hypothetical protein